MNDLWQAISRTVAQEFSTMVDAEQLTRLVLRLLLASMLGFVLGFQRELHGKAAGARTHMLVSIGSCLFVLVPQEAGIAPSDLSRVIQGLLAGVGFLCAGTILKEGRNMQEVQGLTTAASLWMTAAIGTACGLGRGLTAIISAALALGVLAMVPHFTRVLGGDEAPNPENSQRTTKDR